MKKHILIVGAQGAGKSSLARMLAADLGTFVTVAYEDLKQSPFVLGNAVAEQPSAVVVDECEYSSDFLHTIKAYLTSPTIKVHQMMKPDRTVPTPTFIFCMLTPSIEDLNLLDAFRHLKIVKLGG